MPTLKDYYQIEGKLPERIVFALSALITFYKGNFDGEKIALKDDAIVLDFFAGSWAKSESGEISLEKMARDILENSEVWTEDLTQFSGMVEQVSANLKGIENLGIEESLAVLDKGNLAV